MSIYLLVCVEIGLKLIVLSIYNCELESKSFSLSDVSFEANELCIFLFLHPFVFDYFMDVTSIEKENMKVIRYTCWTLLWLFFVVSIILRASLLGSRDICAVTISPLVAIVVMYFENKLHLDVNPTVETAHDIFVPTTINTSLQKHISRKVTNVT